MVQGLPATEYAVELVGPDELRLNKAKAVAQPGPWQVLCQVEAVGLCFSDLKLLKQFSEHARKTEILEGIEEAVLGEIPSYKPGEAATVPGHEAVVRVVAVGEKVTCCAVGDRRLVQTDYRWLPTANSNGSFGYNFEGGLQEYVLMDERVITSPEGESMLIPAGEDLSASAVALVEPWACVEDAYQVRERQGVEERGQMVVVVEEGAVYDEAGLRAYARGSDGPARITWVGGKPAAGLGSWVHVAADVAALADGAFDDVVYFGSRAETVGALMAKVGPGGLLNVVQSGGQFGKAVAMQVGRVHYGGVRVVGTQGNDPREALKTIPATAEVRSGDAVQVVGAGGPMGVMHVVRDICSGVAGLSVYAGDLDDERLAILDRLAGALAKERGVELVTYNAKRAPLERDVDYVVVMAPVWQLVAEAVRSAATGGIINIFAGIAASVVGEIDLDAYIAKRLYFVGTSGSVLEDMKTVLGKVASGQLDTNLSVGAICGMAGAVEGIRAVEAQQIAGKIVVYPACRELGLVTLGQLGEELPEVAACLQDGVWTREAEAKLLGEG